MTVIIYCPICGLKQGSDVIDSIDEIDGQWECPEGHQFVLKYQGVIK